MAIIKGSTIENLTMADIDRQKTTLKILSERNYIKCLKLDLEATNPFMEYEGYEDRLHDDFYAITDSLV